MNKKINKSEFYYGLKRGLPIAMGYVPVAFTFGLMAVSGGMPVWMAVIISLTNLTSAGQFAGTNLIFGGAGYPEIILTTFIINMRYMLMSLSLTQRLDRKMSFSKRLTVAFGVTDEIFTVASMEKGTLSYPFLMGLIIGPVIGWTSGTFLGAFISTALPDALSGAMGIALYAMFIAIILPPAMKSRPITIIVLLSVTITCILKYVPVFHVISPGFRVIIATLLGSGIGALYFPIRESEEPIAQKGEDL